MSDPDAIPLIRRLRYKAELSGFRFAAWLIPQLSRSAVVRLSRMGGALALMFARRHRRIAMANLELAFGASLTDAGRKKILRQVFNTFALTGLDYFWFARDRKQRLEKWVVIHGGNWPWMKDGPKVAVTGHFGNWEVMGWMTAQHGTVVGSVAKPVKNPLIDAEVNRIRTQSGQQIFPRAGALKSLVRVLKGGGTVALLLDQDTLPVEGGVFVPFFGVPVPISTAAAGLALKLKVPIFMAFCVSDPNGVYHGYSREWMMPEDLQGVSAEEVTARIATVIEDAIRKDPGQWLWSYKRWKRRLPGVDPSRYPYYADC